MNTPSRLASQRGATLIVGLIMLAVIMLSVATAFTLSNANLKSVGNMQFRNEAIAAANKAVELVISSPFTDAPSAEEINVDIDNDGTSDYVVQIATPICVQASQVATAGATPSSLTLGFPSGPTYFNTVWDLQAVVNDPASGASVRLHEGVRLLLTEAQRNAVCS